MAEKLTEEQKKQKKAERKRERELSDIRFVIKSPEGRRFYWRVMEEGGVFLDPYQPETNPTYYGLGRQSVSRKFLNELLEAKPEGLSQMQQERESEDTSEHFIEQKEQEQKSVLD